MAVLALVLYAAWALVAFGLRAVVQLRRTGDSGFRRFRGAIGSAEWWAGILFLLAIVVGVVAPVADLLGLHPIAGLDGPLVYTAGAVVAVVGIVATLVAQLAMGDSWRVGVDPDERTALVTTGPFDLVRNPIFTAMAVTALGLMLLVGNWLAVTGLVTLVAALELQVRVVEEPYLLARHGDAYRHYATRVGRFLPGIGRRLSPSRGQPAR